ncbi:MAG: hypothetical protein LC800_07485 [Acidobacteria bacterium]|nr:hypothetical protein [Acidobacteriota bacterium]
MTRFSRVPIPFIAVGTAFLGLGLTGRRTFIYVGVVFIALGLALLVKRTRG